MMPANISKDLQTAKGRPDTALIESINLRLAMAGCPTFGSHTLSGASSLAAPIFARQKETLRLLATYLCPADWRIDHFLKEYLYETGVSLKWPARTFILDYTGFSR